MVALIECGRRALWQSAEACRADWERAQARRPAPWESRWHCLLCPEGAKRAGRSDSLTGLGAHESVRGLCVRCHRLADRIVGNRYCVSCYNRDRELLAGRNGKGGVPTVLARRYALHGQRVAVARGPVPSWSLPDSFSRVSGLVEIALILARQVQQTVLIGRNAECSGIRQLTFWGGC